MEKLSQEQVFSIVQNFATDFGVDSGYFDLLSEAKSDQKYFELLFHFALRGLPAFAAEECIKRSKGNKTILNDLLIDALFDQYTPKDGLQRRISDTEKKVTQTVSDTKVVTDRYVSLVEGLQSTLSAQNQIIENLTKELDSFKNSTNVIQTQDLDYKQPEPSIKLPWRKRRKVEEIERQRQRETESQKFIELYAKNKAYSKEQIAFLTQCLNEGIEVGSFVNFCYPGIDLDLMKRLKDYYVNGSKK
ncbi:MAG: hypothetical protein SPK77_05245 [Lachnospiraceae bacterium]|nr:hypothetical protein [Lachnospiraceae bacterium]